MAILIQLRRATQSEWSSSNPVLDSGEVVIETDTRQVKVGNGSSAYNSLPYAFTPGDISNPFVPFF
jgi:hypothetical protein